jgi:hypothetical protein
MHMDSISMCLNTLNMSNMDVVRGAIGYSWLDGLLRNPWSGVQTPQVLGYSELRVANPLFRGSNPYGAGVSLRGWGLRHHMSNQVTPCCRFPGDTNN